jgi:hypothetical protein
MPLPGDSFFHVLRRLGVGSALLFCACGGLTSSEGFKPDYRDQELQGKINGRTWTYVAGNVRRNFFDSAAYDFALTDSVDGDTCSLFLGDSGTVLFTVYRPSLDTGTYSLHFKLNSDWKDNQTVTFFYVDGQGVSQNKIATQGAFHLAEVDSTSGLRVQGKMDVKFDGSNYANGNFTVKYCR